jgi:hypothetical protein
MVPFPELSEYRNFPSAVMARSRFTAPGGLLPTTGPGRGVSIPVMPIAKPEILAEAEFPVYTKRPSGVIAFQQLAAPSVGTLALIAERVPSPLTAYDETAEPLGTPAAQP